MFEYQNTTSDGMQLNNTKTFNNIQDYKSFTGNDSYKMFNIFATTLPYLNMCNTTSLNCNRSELNDSSFNDNLQNMSFILPWWRQIVWNILFAGMVIIATGGNLIVVWIVVTNKRMRTVTNYFIVNLSIADAMVSSLNVTFNYIYMLDYDWPFGKLYCKISQFIATLSISASVFTMMAISIDRYVAIMQPLKPRMSKRCNLAIAATIWITSTIISYPMLRFYTTEETISKDGVHTVCFPEWPDGTTNHSHQEYIFNVLFMILTYFLPIISMTLTYSRVGFKLWGSKAIGEYTPRQVENVRSKRRVVKMMIVVVLIFTVCWLPFHVYFILTSYYPAITETPFIQEVYLMIYWLAMSNSMYNPIIYCWMNSRFRYGFKLFFRWCPFVHMDNEGFNPRDQLTSRYSCPESPSHTRFKRNDTQKSLIYSCHGSTKATRLAHCSVLRNSNTHLMGQRGVLRHSAPTNGIADTSFYTFQQNYNTKQHIRKNNGNPGAEIKTEICNSDILVGTKSNNKNLYTNAIDWKIPTVEPQNAEKQIVNNQLSEIVTPTETLKTSNIDLMS